MTAKDWFLFWCGVVFGQAPFWICAFGWPGAVPSVIAAACLAATLYKVQRESRLWCACGHPYTWHWQPPRQGCCGVFGRDALGQYIFCPCEKEKA